MKYLLWTVLLFGYNPIPKDIPVYNKAELMGMFDPSRHADFKEIKSKYTNKDEAYLRKEVYNAFKEMWKVARKDGIDLTIISATRNHAYQIKIWNRKWNTFNGSAEEKVKQILQYSSMPGISRHHWGTDFDLNSLENSYFENGNGLKIYNWLQNNAHKYGFFQPYTSYNSFRDKGYKEEKWHWSYYPLASRFQRAYNHLISYDDLRGFEGSEYAGKFEVIENFVNGIEIPQLFLDS